MITTLLLVTIIAVVYELLKAFVLFQATWWQSAAVTMAFFGLSATVAVHRAIRAHAGLLGRAHSSAAPHQHAEHACLAAAIAQAADSIVITDTAGTIQYINPAFTMMTGFHADEVIGQNSRLLKSTRQPPTFYQNLWQTILAGQIWHGALINRRKDGTCYIEEMKITPVRDASGVITQFMAIKQDVTERRAAEHARASAEEAIRQREERYRSLVTNMPDALWTADAQGRAVFASPNHEQMCGYTPEEICQQGVWFDHIHPDDMHRVHDAYAALIATGTMFDVEYRFQRKDGRWIWLHDRAVVSYAQDGKRYTDGILSDVTQRKEAEQALQEAEEKYRSLVVNIPDVVWTVDAERRVAFPSPNIERLLGYTAGERYQRDAAGWFESLHPDDVETVRAAFDALFATRQAYDVEYRMRRKTGEWIWAHDRAIATYEKHGRRYADGLISDMTVRKQAEATLRQAKEAAEAAIRAKNDFLANISHEIRTPLNGVIGITELTLDTELTSEQREYLTIVKTLADVLLSVVNDILDFSKIEARTLDLERIAFPLRESIAATMKGLAIQADHKHLELLCHIEPTVPATVLGDAGRLRQILLNLVGNAIKFTERGKVVVWVKTCAETADVPTLHVSISDTGVGIPREKQHAIFEAFIQADTSATRPFGGTGLGLTIASQLVSLMEGRLWLESEVGRGSTFHFTVPLRVAPTLMDVQMADGEGCEASGAIRPEEEQTG